MPSPGGGRLGRPQLWRYAEARAGVERGEEGTGNEEADEATAAHHTRAIAETSGNMAEGTQGG